MKVMMVSGSLPPIKCGVGYYTQRLLSSLKDYPVEFEILTTKGAESDLPSHKVHYVADWKLAHLPRLLRIIRSSSPDIIHLQYPTVPYQRQLGVNLIPLFVRLLMPKVKITVTLHEYHGSGFLGRTRNRITAWPAHRAVVSNTWDQRSLPASINKRSQIIPIGSNLELTPKSPDSYNKILRKFGLDPKTPTLLFFGFAYPNKGLENLIQALDQAELSDWQLLILSELDIKNPYHKKLSAMIDAINRPGKRIAAAGFLPDHQVSQVLSQGKYFVLPQPIPLTAKSSTAIAAIQHGLIIISKAARDKSLQSPYVDMVNSRLLPEVGPSELAIGIEQLDKDPAELKTLKSGLEKLQSYFSWESIAKDHMGMYKDLV